MWRARQKELKMDDRLREGSGYDDNCSKNYGDVGDIPRSTGRRHSVNENNTRVSSSSSKRVGSSYSREDEGLRDEEVEEILHSRSLKNSFSHTHMFFPSSVDSFYCTNIICGFFQDSQGKKKLTVLAWIFLLMTGLSEVELQ